MMSSTDWSLTNWSQVEAGFIGAVRLGILVCRDLKARFRYTESGIVKPVANQSLALALYEHYFHMHRRSSHAKPCRNRSNRNVSNATISSFRFRCSSIDTVQKRANLYDIGAGW